MTLSRRDFLRLAGLSSLGLLAGLRLLRGSAVGLRVLAVERLVNNAAFAAFTSATGIPVKLNLAARFAAADYGGCDLLVVPAHALTFLIQRGLVRELPALPSVQTEQRPYDPLNAFSVLAARAVIGANSRGGPPPGSWAEFFAAARVAPSCLPPRETFNAALKSLGHSINTRDEYARRLAQSMVDELRSIPLGGAQLAIGPRLPGWSFTVPREGAELREDCYCLPLSAPRIDLATAFLKFAAAAPPPASAFDRRDDLEIFSPFTPQTAG